MVLIQQVYVLGGDGGQGKFLKTCESFYPKINQWSQIADMKMARKSPAVAADEDRLYAIGGFNETGTLKSVEIFHFQLKRWTTGAEMKTPRQEAAAAVHRGYIYVVGG